MECTIQPIAAASWIQTPQSPITAAEAAEKYRGGGCSGWYLPSKDEMSAVFQVMKKNDASVFPDGYWSSTPADSSSVWYQNTVYGYVDIAEKTDVIAVRPVRRFK